MSCSVVVVVPVVVDVVVGGEVNAAVPCAEVADDSVVMTEASAVEV